MAANVAPALLRKHIMKGWSIMTTVPTALETGLYTGAQPANKGHESRVIPFKFDEENGLQAALLPTPDKLRKFFGGSKKEHPYWMETPMDTAVRELEEESGLLVVKKDLVHLSHYRHSLHGHMVYFYMVFPMTYGGTLRTEEKHDEKSLLLVPKWEKISEIEWSVIDAHRAAYRKALSLIASYNVRLKRCRA